MYLILERLLLLLYGTLKSCVFVEGSDYTFPFMLNIALSGLGLLWTDVGREGETTFGNV